MIQAQRFNRRGAGFPGPFRSPFSVRRRTPVVNTTPRNFASGVRAPGIGSGTLSNGTDTTQNFRASHHNMAGVSMTGFKLGYCGWYLDATSEVICPNDYTVSVSIEYPAGTYTRVTWDNGATSKVIAAGQALVLSDAININIPKDAQFWVITYVSVSPGQRWPLCHNRVSSLGEQGELGIGLTDKTLVGGVSGASQGLRPAAIIGYAAGMKSVSLAGMGDSIIHGSGDGTFDGRGNTSWIGRAATIADIPYLPIAVVGTTLASQVVANKLNYRLAYLQAAGITHIVANWGINDTGSGFSTFQTNLNTLWAALATTGARVYHTTLGPRSTSTDAWYTVSRQTAHSQYNGSSATGHQINDYIRTTPSPLSGYLETADVLSTSRYSGLWKTGDSHPDVNLLTSDNLTVSGTPTTTNVPTNSARATNYYQFGGAEFTSGVLNGTIRTTGVANTGANVTFSSALASAPAAGDTVIARASAIRTNNDGIHPAVLTNTALSGQIFGGHLMTRDYAATFLAGL